MNVWTELDVMVRKHRDRGAELVELAKEGRMWRKPRFTPPCVWTLIERRRGGDHVPITLVFTEWEPARAQLQAAVDARLEREREREQAKDQGGST